MSKYKVGDKVKIVRTGGLNPVARGRYIGEVVTIKSVNPNAGFTYGEHYGVDGNSPFIYFENELEPYVEEKKMFTKSDLKNGDVIVRRNGSVEITIVDRNVFISRTGWNKLADIKDDLTDIDSDFWDNEWDIMKVYRPKVCHQCQFETEDHGELVFDRERDTKKLYNGKVVCVDLNGYNKCMYTVGKIYEFKNGCMTCDDGYVFGEDTDEKFYTFEDWANFTSSKFIEVVE